MGAVVTNPKDGCRRPGTNSMKGTTMTLNLVRLGHYFTPEHSEGEAVHGSCRTALVVHAEDEGLVNLAVWNSNGGQEVRSSIPVTEPEDEIHADSFHLSADCPWKR